MSLRERFIADGIVLIPDAVSASVVDGIRAQLRRELADPCVTAESGRERNASTPLALDDPSTWPRGNARRVIEVVAPSDGAPWDALRNSPELAKALDEVLGRAAWDIELNAVDERRRACDVRHWYCPVTFPEKDSEQAMLVAEEAKARAARAEQSEKRRKVSDESGACAPAPARWTECDSGNVRKLKEGGHNWDAIAKMMSTSELTWTAKQCEEHYESAWAPEHDAALLAAVTEHGEKWQYITQLMQRVRPSCTKKQVRGRAMMLLDERSANIVDRQVREGSPEPKAEELEAARSWHPVNRRRMLNRGWHLDIGAGFSTDAQRTPDGHPYQGVIILVFLTDCVPGGGGTAFIKGSHKWIASHLRSKGGINHQDLNSWAIDLVSELSTEGRLPLSYELDAHEAENAIRRDDIDGVIEQLVGKAGTVALLHPWMIHSGTSNLTSSVRLLANGMARVKQESYEQVGIPILKEVVSAKPKLKRVLDFLVSTSPKEQPVRPPVDTTLPSVSIIVPVYNASRWLDETLSSICAQTYRGPIEVSIFDDSSTDGSPDIIKIWREAFTRVGIAVVVNGSRWPESSKFVAEDAPNFGIGFCRNRCIEQSHGDILVFLDSDDVMMPQRLELQVPLAAENRTAIVGGCWKRYPSGSTEHYEAWANMMTQNELHLEQFRECTVLLPTWCMARTVAETVGGFVEAPPGSGEAEDLIFFQRHLALNYEQNLKKGLPSLLRAGDYPHNPVLLYRWSPQSASARCSRRRLLQVRAQAFEERILPMKSWEKFIVWGAGRDAKNFMNEISPAARARVEAMIDIDPRKTGRQYTNSQAPDQAPVPIVHFSKAPRGLPVVVCVAKRRKGSGDSGDLESNVDTLGLIEGTTLWYFN
jgi:glycosyltransferase involved in cell wall biosynthesis/ectoine hydroxylase-related dioxygenase (phytanoyl-CoA dioxygenase family)